jgi:hypothetical protein
MGRLQADTSWTTCRSLEMKLSVWRLCWISGGYRLEAASRPIALYIVGIRGAQGRSQHYKSGTGTLVESESWLAMADCLGRFGRASHSNPRYHSPTQNFGQVQMHVQRNSCGSCDQIRPCFICTPPAFLQDQLPIAVVLSSVRALYCLFARRILQDVLPSDHESLHMPFARRRSEWCSPSDPLCSRGLQSLTLKAWHRPHLSPCPQQDLHTQDRRPCVEAVTSYP